MASREKHKQRSCRSYNSNSRSFASHAVSAAGKVQQKQQKKSVFDNLKKLFTGAFKKNKEG